MKETNEYFNQRIDCNVHTCKYQDCHENRCSLGKIFVNGENSKQRTFCDSFEKSEKSE